MVEVVLTVEGRVTARRVFGPGEYFIGRDPACHIAADTPEVSQRHARLFIEDTGIRLEDLGSTNGTFVGGQAITSFVNLSTPCRIKAGSALIDLSLVEPAKALPPPVPDAELKHARNYQVGTEIARGGMGAVLEAEDRNLCRKVAMKVVLSGKAASRESRLRFIREARVLGQLEHPNIVPIHELGIDQEGRVFYTMKRVKGITLHQLLAEIQSGNKETIAQYPLSQLLAIFQKVCDGMSYAHAKGIIHRDLKPANIMIGEHGEVLVMDWGLAKILSSATTVEKSFPGAAELCEAEEPVLEQARQDSLQTLEGRVMGSPHYMAPEQAAGRIGEMDERTDIYALGGILYHLLTLRPPVTGKDLTTILELIRTGEIRPPVERQWFGGSGLREEQPDEGRRGGFPHCPGGKVPAALSAVSMKALALRPKHRYSSVAELQRDIAAYQNGFATAAELPGPWTLIRLWIRRHKTAFATAVVVSTFLIAASILVVSMWVELRGTAPVFYEKAQALVSQQKFAEALAPIGYAIQRAPKKPEYWILKGNVYESLLRLEEAKTAYRQALGLKADLALARQNLELCDRILGDRQGRGALTSACLAELQSAIRGQGRREEADALLRRLLAEDQTERSKFYREWRKQLDQGGIAGRLTIDDAGKVELDLYGLPVADLSALRGIPLNTLNLGATKVSNLDPLRGMRLERLHLTDAPGIRNIAPLKGMPLRELHLSGSGVTNLDPLVGMPLEYLSIPLTTSDLRRLQGLPLQGLGLAGCSRITNLGPLRGMPLKNLDLQGSAVADLSPVLQAPLEGLMLDHTPFTNFPLLTNFHLSGLGLCYTRFHDLSLLKHCQLRELMLDKTPIADLRLIEGHPLNWLSLSGTPVSDLTPLIAAPLDRLFLDSTKVSDLTPLRGKNIRYLHLGHTRITDLSPIQDLPLEELWLDGCDGLKDLSSLTNLTKLRSLCLPAQVKDLDFLRCLPDLQQLGYTQPLMPAGEFWKSYEARKTK